MDNILNDAIKNKDYTLIRTILKNEIYLESKGKNLEEKLREVEKRGINIFEIHDGEQFLDKGLWTEKYKTSQMTKLMDNFSKERLEFLKRISKYLLSEKETQTTKARVYKSSGERKIRKTSDCNGKNIGLGVIGGGAILTAVGLVAQKTVFVGLGAVAIIVGGIIVIKSNMND